MEKSPKPTNSELKVFENKNCLNIYEYVAFNCIDAVHDEAETMKVFYLYVSNNKALVECHCYVDVFPK
jgi:hypothetical protein